MIADYSSYLELLAAVYISMLLDVDTLNKLWYPKNYYTRIKDTLDNVFSEEEGDVKDYYLNELDREKLHEYVLKNTYEKGIRLLRRYYGITARK